jgi:DNA-binding transcriptional ArsR family regulator
MAELCVLTGFGHTDSEIPECLGRLVIELVLNPAGVRFGISPLDEALGAMQTILGLRGHPSHLPWLENIPRELPVPELAAVMSARHYITDFLSPPPDGPLTTAEAQLAEIRRTPPSQVATELAMVDADLSALPKDPGVARDLLADQLELVWTELLAPHWPRIHQLLAADIEYRSRRLAEGGVALALDGLHSQVRLVEDVLMIDVKARSRIRLDRRGLLLIPGVFAWPNVGVITVPPWQPALLYPARGVASLWTAAARPRTALAGILGRTKAALLTALDDPASTSALATRLGLSNGTVSGHLTAMRAAGLLTTNRRGHAVHYRRTELGDAILRT